MRNFIVYLIAPLIYGVIFGLIFADAVDNYGEFYWGIFTLLVSSAIYAILLKIVVKNIPVLNILIAIVSINIFSIIFWVLSINSLL